MDERVKRLWNDALRSGEYEPGQGKLKTAKGKFCCLGVLCDLYRKETGTGEWEEVTAGTTDEGTERVIYYKFNVGPEEIDADYLPLVVMEWAGLDQVNPEVLDDPDDPGSALSLADMNDTGKSFDEIAQAIEENL